MQLFEAIRRGCLLEILSVWHWVTLVYPDPDNQLDFEDKVKKRILRMDRKILSDDMIQACHDSHLKYEIINERIPLKKPKPNSYLLSDGISLSGWGRFESKPLEIWPLTDYGIQKDDFKQFLQESGKMPVDGLVRKLLFDDELETEVIENGASNQTESKFLKNPRNETKFSGLLNIPSRIDSWFYVIEDMTRDFYKKYGRIPIEIQAWGALWESPPEGYKITKDMDRGEDCLKMPGTANLSHSAFIERWKKYTA